MTIASVNPSVQYRQPRDLVPHDVWQALIADVTKAHPGTGRVMAERIIGQTIAFLIAGMATAEALSPSEAVDRGWHAFLLRTQAYHEFCDRHAGRFLHHQPGPSVGAEPDGAEVVRNRTLEAICAAGFDVDVELWPEVADCTQCHSGCTDSPVGGKR